MNRGWSWRAGFVAIALGWALLLAASPRAGAQADEDAPDLSLITGKVSITAPDIDLGRLLDYVSERTGTPIIPDRRFSGVRLTVLGAEGPASGLLEAVEAATGMQFRKLDDWYVLSPDRRGAAAVAHEYRQREGKTLLADRAALSVRADSVARRVGMRFRAMSPPSYLTGLTEQQAALFQRQGFLTVADLFPEYYQPMYDIFGDLVEPSSQRPASLPEFAGTRVYYYSNLQLLVYLPVKPAAEGATSAQPPAQPPTWTIDLGGF